MNMKKNFLTCFLALLVVIGFSWGFYQLADKEKAAVSVENSGERYFYDLVDSLEKMSSLSGKALVSADTAALSKIYAELYSEAYIAEQVLSSLPMDFDGIKRTEQFLNQMGDFSLVLVKKAAGGTDITSKEYGTLTDLHNEVSKISASLNELAERDEDLFSWSAMKSSANAIEKNDAAKAGLASSTFGSVNDDLEEVPALIYDGPFSDRLESAGPVELSGSATTWEEAIALAKKLFGDDYRYTSLSKTGQKAKINVMTVALKAKNSDDTIGWLDVSAKGCYPVQYTSYTNQAEEKIGVDDCLSVGAKFIKKAGYSNMKQVYYLVEDGILTANFVYNEGGVLVYPDMIKVSVNMETGEVCGLDAVNYLSSHKDRDYADSFGISADKAKEKLIPALKPTAVAKVIIPLDNGGERFCYEFRFKLNNENWLVYIDGTTGEQNDVLGLYVTENGSFTL